MCIINNYTWNIKWLLLLYKNQDESNSILFYFELKFNLIFIVSAKKKGKLKSYNSSSCKEKLLTNWHELMFNQLTLAHIIHEDTLYIMLFFAAHFLYQYFIYQRNERKKESKA